MRNGGVPPKCDTPGDRSEAMAKANKRKSRSTLLEAGHKKNRDPKGEIRNKNVS